jgi:hypothetical protein
MWPRPLTRIQTNFPFIIDETFKIKFLLLGAYESGTDSESDNDSNISSEDKKDVKPLQMKIEAGESPPEILANPFSKSGGGRVLPKPSFLQESEKIAGIKFDSSVFSNPFRYFNYQTKYIDLSVLAVILLALYSVPVYGRIPVPVLPGFTGQTFEYR